ncbi:MAG TPA: hypothetical protein VJ746_17840, partial [Nitrospira sp.]|nr:hypothetical protein [Nitrospira sp.]
HQYHGPPALTMANLPYMRRVGLPGTHDRQTSDVMRAHHWALQGSGADRLVELPEFLSIPAKGRHLIDSNALPRRGES